MINQAGPSVKVGKFRVIVDDFPSGNFTKFKIPGFKQKNTQIDQAGSVVPRFEVSGMGEYDGDCEFTGFQDTNGQFERALQRWSNKGADPVAGKASGKPQDAAKTITVEQLDIDDAVIHEWEIDCIPGALNPIELEGGKADAVSRTMSVKPNLIKPVR